MFDLLMEALKELFDPRPRDQRNAQGQENPKPARPNRPRRQAVDTFGGSTLEVEVDQPAYPGQPPGRPAERTYTLEDIVKKLVGFEDWDEPAAARQKTAPPSAPPSRPEPPQRPRRQGQNRPKPPQQAAPKKPARTEETPAMAELDKYADGQDLGRLAPLDASANGRSDHGLDFVEALRDNPHAVRDAFVYSVIFGRPIGERPLEEP